MWTALLGSEVVDLESMAAGDKITIRTDGALTFECRGCRGSVHTRRIPTGDPLVDEIDPFIVFCHNPGEAEKCRALGLSYDESPEHHRLKSRLARAARRVGWSVELEVHHDSMCRADVVATRQNGNQWAFEAQLAQLGTPKAVERNDRYARAFGNCTWVHTGRREWSTRIPSLRIDTSDDPTVVGGIHTSDDREAAPEALDSVVPRILNGGLTYVSVDAYGFYLDLRAQPGIGQRTHSTDRSFHGGHVRDCDRPRPKASPSRLKSPFEQRLEAADETQRLELLAGRARMARARAAAGLPLDDLDLEALDQFPLED